MIFLQEMVEPRLGAMASGRIPALKWQTQSTSTLQGHDCWQMWLPAQSAGKPSTVLRLLRTVRDDSVPGLLLLTSHRARRLRAGCNGASSKPGYQAKPAFGGSKTARGSCTNRKL